MKNFILDPETLKAKTAELMACIQDILSTGKAMVEVRKYNRQQEVTLAQMAYIHCQNGPIKMYAKEHGYSDLEAELILKRHCGEHLFVHELKGDNWFNMMEKKGVAYFECVSPLCRRLTEPEHIKRDGLTRVCPHCWTKQPRVIIILSKTELNTKQTAEWIESMYHWLRDEHRIKVELPNKEWRLE